MLEKDVGIAGRPVPVRGSFSQSFMLSSVTGVGSDLMKRDDERGREAAFYPVFIPLEGRTCLVVGGGAVGERKIRGVLPYGALVRVVAREVTDWIEARSRKDECLVIVGDSYRESYLEGVDLVFAATSDLELNRRVAEDARGRRVLCNMATEPDRGSFIVPSVVRQGPLTLAIGTEGCSPALAKRIREKLEGQFGPEWAFFIDFMGRLRSAIQVGGLASAENQRLFREVAALPIPEWVLEGKRGSALDAIGQICRPWLDAGQLSRLWDDAWIPFSSLLPPCATVAAPSDT